MQWQMCEDKWNGLNFNFKNISNYHIGIDRHTSFWDLISKECDSHHLRRQCNKNLYDVIKFF